MPTSDIKARAFDRLRNLRERAPMYSPTREGIMCFVCAIVWMVNDRFDAAGFSERHMGKAFDHSTSTAWPDSDWVDQVVDEAVVAVQESAD